MDRLATQELFSSVQNIAIVGAKDKEGQPVNRVGRYLMEVGFDVIPVHPTRQDVWGLKTYVKLTDVPSRIDIVVLFRAPEACLVHAEECLLLPQLPTVFWMQQGISNPDAVALIAPRGVEVVQDKCIMVEHAKAFGLSVPSAGLQTLYR